MDHYLLELFADGSALMAAVLMALSLQLMLHGLKDLRQDHPEGYLYITIALFLTIAQFIVFQAAVEMQSNSGWMGGSLLSWALTVFIPALIGLFFFRSVMALVFFRGREGLIKMFFGLTLFCFLYMLGESWPTDIKIILSGIWLLILFKTEFAFAR